jgi:predicted nuclease of restriction endonuclease-like (RecB) superfamily
METTLQSGEYKDFLSGVKSEIRNAQIKAMVKVNKELILLYWNLGKQILEMQTRYSWGDKVIEQLSKDLQSEFPNSSGYARRNLFYMKKFYLANQDYELVQSVTALISWTHNVLLLDRIKDAKERLWYAENSLKYGWSVRMLDHQIDAKQYERSGKAINNFDTTLPAPQSDMARDLLKDPYNFDFLVLSQDFAEKDLEEALVKHITNFLLELGTGFAFVGRQYVVTVDNKDYKIDLLFYHLKLRCYVVIELKAKDFEPEFAGKLNFYINVVNGEVKDKTDNPTIGILLCKNKSGKTIVEYALNNINAPIGVSGYTVSNALPSVETLQRELENVVSEFEENKANDIQ